MLYHFQKHLCTGYTTKISKINVISDLYENPLNVEKACHDHLSCFNHL